MNLTPTGNFNYITLEIWLKFPHLTTNVLEYVETVENLDNWKTKFMFAGVAKVKQAIQDLNDEENYFD